ncbi:hypothetical protein GQ53DRAFT_754351 [Thozetella sp. PMI_491]|nr:hypothetical protein GQ53DRAFT_754351 [Thozetella sp. PMI_491]
MLMFHAVERKGAKNRKGRRVPRLQVWNCYGTHARTDLIWPPYYYDPVTPRHQMLVPHSVLTCIPYFQYRDRAPSSEGLLSPLCAVLCRHMPALAEAETAQAPCVMCPEPGAPIPSRSLVAGGQLTNLPSILSDQPHNLCADRHCTGLHPPLSPVPLKGVRKETILTRHSTTRPWLLLRVPVLVQAAASLARSSHLVLLVGQGGWWAMLDVTEMRAAWELPPIPAHPPHSPMIDGRLARPHETAAPRLESLSIWVICPPPSVVAGRVL